MKNIISFDIFLQQLNQNVAQRFLLYHVKFKAFTVTCKRVEFPPPYEPECLVGKEDPFDESKSYEVPWFDVDLDAPAKERWKHVVRPFKNQILAVFDVLAVK